MLEVARRARPFRFHWKLWPPSALRQRARNVQTARGEARVVVLEAVALVAEVDAVVELVEHLVEVSGQ